MFVPFFSGAPQCSSTDQIDDRVLYLVSGCFALLPTIRGFICHGNMYKNMVHKEASQKLVFLEGLQSGANHIACTKKFTNSPVHLQQYISYNNG